MTTYPRNGLGFTGGALIGTLGGLIGLGGAEFRLPMLVAVFKLPTLQALILNGWLRWLVGLATGFGIGVVAALLGMAGGELLIPTIVLLYGLDIKLAGSLSLMVSLPTMVVGLARYARADAFAIIQQEQPLIRWMVAGSILGAALGGLLLGLVPTRPLMGLLGLLLLVSAVMTFQHSRELNKGTTCF